MGGLALLVVFSTCVAAIAGSSRSKQQANPAAVATAGGAVAKTAPAQGGAKATPDGSCAPQPCANDNFGWIVTASDLKNNAATGNQFEKPEAGNVFVTVAVSFQNKTKTEQHANPTSFVLKDVAGIKHTVTWLSSCELWSPVNLSPGATLGPKCLAFQASSGQPTGLVLVWTPQLGGGDYNMKLN